MDFAYNILLSILLVFFVGFATGDFDQATRTSKR